MSYYYYYFLLLLIITSLFPEDYYELYLFSFVETPGKFIVAKLSIRKLGSSSVLTILIMQTYKELTTS